MSKLFMRRTASGKGTVNVWDPRSYRDTDYGLEPGESFEPEDAWNTETGISTGEPHVMTLLGPIDPIELGVCLTHVHLLCNPPALTGEEPDYRLDDEDKSEEEIEAFVTMNGRSLVESSTRDYGRNIEGLVRIAGWAPVHLVSVTGRHHHLHAARMPNALDVESLAAEFIADLQVGMDGTQARAGAIKIGTSRDAVTDVERAAIEAAAVAHQQTGAPITSEAEDGTMVLEQLELLNRHHVAPGRVIVGQLDRRPMDPAYLRAIADTGACLSFDQMGKSERFTDTDRALLIHALVEDGYADQIVLSEDYDRKSLLLAYGGAPGLAYLQEWFMVTLMEIGLDAVTIRKMVVDNPARMLTIQPPDSER
jgi:5-phospho-D-xylono-1,4-lactonase